MSSFADDPAYDALFFGYLYIITQDKEQIKTARDFADLIKKFVDAELGQSGISALTGDVAAVGPGSAVATIQPNVVTYSKFQQVAASSLVGNPTGSLANAVGITLGAGLAFSGTTLIATGSGGITQLTSDVTAGPGSGSQVATISVHAVTYAKMQQASTVTLLGNPTGGTANVQEITLGTNLSFAGSVLNATPGAGGMTQLTGDVTAGPGTGSQVATISNNAVTYSKFQQVAASSLVGNPTGSLANSQGITLGAGLSFSGTTLISTALLSAYYQTVQANGSAQPQQPILNFSVDLPAVNNGGNTSTDISLVNTGSPGTYGGTGEFIQTIQTDTKGRVTFVAATTGAPSASYKWSINTLGSGGTVSPNSATVIVPGDSGAVLTTAGLITQTPGNTVPQAVASSWAQPSAVPIYTTGSAFATGIISFTMPYAPATGSGSGILEFTLWMVQTDPTVTGNYTQLGVVTSGIGVGTNHFINQTATFSTTVPAGSMIFVAMRRTDTNAGLTLTPVLWTAILEMSK